MAMSALTEKGLDEQNRRRASGEAHIGVRSGCGDDFNVSFNHGALATVAANAEVLRFTNNFLRRRYNDANRCSLPNHALRFHPASVKLRDVFYDG